MLTLLAKLTVASEYRETLMQILIEDGQISLKDEPGTLRFDLIQDSSDPNILFLYEVYENEEAFVDHTQGEGFKKFIAVFKELEAENACQMERITTGIPLFPSRESSAWQK
ncbi:MAG: putative quinol monooxygenase [Microcystaceae cyanobacterium]